MQTLTQILFSGLGGHANVAFNLIEAQKPGSTQNHLIFYGIEKLPDTYKNFCVKNGVSYHAVYKKKGLDFASWRKVHQILKQTKERQIIVHSVQLLLAVKWYSLFNKARFLTVEHTPNQVKTKAEWLFTALGFLFSPKVVLLTEAYKQELESKWYFNAKKVAVIPNGINTQFFVSGEPKSPTQQVSISMLGRFSYQKQQDKLIEAFALVQQKYPNSLLRLAGTGTDWERCKALATSLQLNGKVQFEGMLNETEIRELLQQTDIYVHASTGETLSTAIIQAMSCGLPIIGSNIPGIAQMIKEGENGLLVDTYNIEAFAEKMLFLIENESKRKYLGENARKTQCRHQNHRKRSATL